MKKINVKLNIVICFAFFQAIILKGQVKDIEGNQYNTIKIGTQEWMGENLKVTHFNDGTKIMNIQDDSIWANMTSPAYCWFENDSIVNKQKYGALYNWFTTNPLINGNKNICPEGWTVPNSDEWDILIDYLGGRLVAGGKMKTTGTFETGTGEWFEPNLFATNESNFSAIPAGNRNGKFGKNDGIFYNLHFGCFFWSSTESSNNNLDAWLKQVGGTYNGSVNSIEGPKSNGFSIRCLKSTSTSNIDKNLDNFNIELLVKSNELKIISTESFSKIYIYSSDGKLIYSNLNHFSNSLIINIQNISNGIYFVQLNEQKNIIKKFVKISGN